MLSQKQSRGRATHRLQQHLKEPILVSEQFKKGSSFYRTHTLLQRPISVSYDVQNDERHTTEEDLSATDKVDGSRDNLWWGRTSIHIGGNEGVCERKGTPRGVTGGVSWRPEP